MTSGRVMLLGFLGAIVLTYVLTLAVNRIPNTVPFPIVAAAGALVLPTSALAAAYFLRARQPKASASLLILFFVACVTLLWFGGLIVAQLQGRLEF